MKPQPALPCLFLPAWCPAQLDAELQVIHSDGQTEQQVSLAQALEELKGQVSALIVPVEHTASCAVSLPAGSAHWQRQALPYAVEPLLAEDVDALHLALGASLDDGRHRVIAINRALIQGWLAWLRERGLQIAAIHVDADLLPDQRPALYWDDSRCLLAGRDELRLAVSPAQLPLAVATISGGHVFHAAGVHPQLPPDADVTLHALELAPHAWLAQQRAHALDIAQGDLASRSRASLRHWRPVAIALAAVLVAQLAFNGMQSWLLNQQAAGYRQVNEAIYKGLFPEDKRIVNLKAQFDQHLQRGTSAARLGELLAALANAMPADATVQVKRLEFQAATAQLRVQLHGGNAAAYDGVQQRLQAGRWKVTGTPLDGGAMQLSVEAAQ